MLRLRPVNSGWIVWLTGLSGAGKTTLASEVTAIMSTSGAGPAELIDGDVLRKELGGRLGFDRASRDINVAVAGFVARTLAERDRPVIVSLISPYDEARREQRERAEAAGIKFFIVHVFAPMNILVARDTKGLYSRAGRGQVTKLTGVDDVYEAPEQPDLVVDTSVDEPGGSAMDLVRMLIGRGILIEDSHDFTI